MVAEHYFCLNCGIHTFGHPRAAPDKFVVNVNTLDDWDVHSETLEIRLFDGRNWGEGVCRERRSGTVARREYRHFNNRRWADWLERRVSPGEIR